MREREQVTGALARSLWRGAGASRSLKGGEVGADPWVGPEGRLRRSPHLLGGAVCRHHVQYPAFAPGTSEVAAGFWSFLYLVNNLPQLLMQAVVFSPL